jgi:hypothetical protein
MEGENEKQVTMMFNIFGKADTVIAWLGEADADSDVAIVCINDQRALEDIDRRWERYEALISFYSRPWLGRTWIRQEIYAAGHLVVRCGAHKREWSSFLRGATLMAELATLVFHGPNQYPELHHKIEALLKEALANSTTTREGRKPRELFPLFCCNPGPSELPMSETQFTRSWVCVPFEHRQIMADP